MSTSDKHTVYIDIDDEITAIIDKVKLSPGKIVALVLPKRATVLQSVVNMKLLKKAAGDVKKNLVLITSESGLLPLAGSVGLHVAKSLQSKPIIPALPHHDDELDPEISDEAGDEPVIDKSKSIGTLAGHTEKEDETETIALDDSAEDEDNEDKAPTSKENKKGKGFKIPNFDRFRLSFFLVVLGVIVLIGGWIFAATVLPKATVTIKTDSSTIPSSFIFTTNTGITEPSPEKGLVPAIKKEVKKTDTEKATATGKKDDGKKATGTMTLTNCIHDTNSHTVPAGTGFSSGSLTFVTDKDVTLDVAVYQGNTCKSSNFGFSKDVTVTAVNGGTGYNLDARSYTSSISGINASGTAMAGGTTSVITVVAQADVDGAVAKMKGRLDDAAKNELDSLLQADTLTGLKNTLVISEPAVTTTPTVGQPATGDITVTSITTYDILGVKADYLSQLIKKDVAGKIETSKQSVLDDGLSSAVIIVSKRKSATEVEMNLQALVIAGPELNADTIKNDIKGKKKGDAERIISSNTGVTSVTIKYSPFWVYKMPKSASKITIIIEKPVVKPAAEATNEVIDDTNL